MRGGFGGEGGPVQHSDSLTVRHPAAPGTVQPQGSPGPQRALISCSCVCSDPPSSEPLRGSSAFHSPVQNSAQPGEQCTAW